MFAAAAPATAAPEGLVVTCVSAFPDVFVTEPFVAISLIIACSLDIASKLYDTSPEGVIAPIGAILVERSSSPIIAHLSGTIIGSTSLNSPVLTNNEVLGLSSTGISVGTVASSAAVIMLINLVSVS